VILDRGHLRWGIFTAAAFVVASVAYALYAADAAGGPSGGSVSGLTFGIIGTVLILLAALLGVRKRRPHYRWGRASTWLKGHLWLGALSFPVILFHGGFEFGGALTQVLMWMFILVFATGILGLGLQQFLPRLMTKNVPQETVYEQIDHVREQLFEEAGQLARGQAKSTAAVAHAKEGGAIQGRVVKGSVATEESDEDTGTDDRAPVVRFVEDYMRPYFQRNGAKGSELYAPHRRSALFDELRLVVKPDLHGVTRDLEALCAQRGQLEAQRRLHHWLHAWLLVHVPLSWGMVFLTAVHAVMALYY